MIISHGEQFANLLWVGYSRQIPVVEFEGLFDNFSLNWHLQISLLCMRVFFMALITTPVLCARSRDLVMSVLVRRVYVVFSTAEFKGGGKPCHKTRETLALRRGIQKASRT